jgi:outer membrane protein assembly factor BamB
VLLIVAAQLAVLLALAACARLGVPEGSSQGVVVDDTLYIGTMDGDLRALDIGTGETVWSFELRGEEPANRAIYGSPAVAGDALYIGGYDGILYALPLDGGDGGDQVREIWDVIVGGGEPIVGSPVIADGLVLVGSSDGSLYAFDTSDGSFRWSFPTGNKIWSTPAVADGVAYFGSLGHKVYAVSVEDGIEVWPSPFEAQGAITATPLIVNGRVYVGAFDSVFYAIDAGTGREVRRFEGASKWFWGGAVAAGDTVYAPSLDGNLYALDIDTLELRWTLETGGPLVGSPVVVFDRIAVPSLDGWVRIVGLGEGLGEQKCNVGAKLRASLTVHQDVIYLAAGDHSIRALRVKSNGNPDEEWVHRTDEDVTVPLDWVRSC